MNEHDATEPSPAQQDEARSWVVLLASGKVTSAEATRFRRWHGANPANAQAFILAKRHWEVMGAATEEMARQQPGGRVYARKETIATRRWILGAGAMSMAAGLGTLLVHPPLGLWSPVVDFGADYHTGIGETRSIAINDATVQLTTRSRIALEKDQSDGVRLALLDGEAAISAGAKPVVVAAGAGITQSKDGRFVVRNEDSTVRVTCLAGTVEVKCGQERAQMTPGQQIRYGAHGISSIATVDPDEVTSWLRGALVFRNRKLRDVVDEVNRYRPGRIILLNEELGQRPVALASFQIDRLEEIVPQIEALYGARARNLPGGIVLLS